MSSALIIILAVEVFWIIFGGMANGLHEAYLMPNWVYFCLIYIFAAVIDYIAIQLLSSLPTTQKTTRYVEYLIILFCTSMAVHVIGATGFHYDIVALLRVYDAIGVIILMLEAGVFMAYGVSTLHQRNRIHHATNSKGRPWT